MQLLAIHGVLRGLAHEAPEAAFPGGTLVALLCYKACDVVPNCFLRTEAGTQVQYAPQGMANIARLASSRLHPSWSVYFCDLER